MGAATPDEPAGADSPGMAPDHGLSRLLADLGVETCDLDLLHLALRHPSVPSEQEGDPLDSNERLEYLGDAVIELAVSEWLFHRLPNCDEGVLTTTRSVVVRGSSLSKAAQRVALGELLELGRSTDQAGGRRRRSILGSAFEAVIGAVFVDQGWETARDAVLTVLAETIELALVEPHRNFKGELQELTQGWTGQGPHYELVETLGPAHQREFVVEVRLLDRALGRGRGHSKKQAEQAAAEVALTSLAGETAATSDAGGGSKEVRTDQ